MPIHDKQNDRLRAVKIGPGSYIIPNAYRGSREPFEGSKLFPKGDIQEVVDTPTDPNTE